MNDASRQIGRSRNFYDELAGDYDRMVNFKRRLKAARQFVCRLRNQMDVASALDVGCGTGAYAIALALEGVRASGADISAAMLERAAAHARNVDVSIEWHQVAVQELRQATDASFDLILCLGNTLPHLESPDQLRAGIGAMASRLTRGGHLVIQLLNYARILKRRERIVSVDREGNTEYVRFYDFLDAQQLLRFNLLTINWGANESADTDLQETLLRPYHSEDLLPPLADHGLHPEIIAGNLELAPFVREESPTLLLVLKKS